MEQIRTELLCKEVELKRALKRIKDKIKYVSKKIEETKIEEKEKKKKEKNNWLDVLKDIHRTEVLQDIANKCRLPISVIISIKMGVYKANENVEKNIKYVLKEMGLYGKSN